MTNNRNVPCLPGISLEITPLKSTFYIELLYVCIVEGLLEIRWDYLHNTYSTDTVEEHRMMTSTKDGGT